MVDLSDIRARYREQRKRSVRLRKAHAAVRAKGAAHFRRLMEALDGGASIEAAAQAAGYTLKTVKAVLWRRCGTTVAEKALATWRDAHEQETPE